MDIISNATNAIMIGLAAAVGILLLIMLFISLRNPIVAKMGIRNIPRRPVQSFLIVLGLTLSTIIIIVSLSTGDTLNRSVRNQAIAAYGEIDEILSPPLLATLAQLGVNFDEEGEPALEEESTLEPDLLEGGLSSVLALLEEGLPAISEERYAELRDEALEEPLIDAVAPSIIFPTIIRNTSTGQGEPFGFIFAVGSEYEEQFGLETIEGRPADVETLRTGVGNIFEFAANLFAAANDATSDLAARLGFEDVQVSDVALGAAAVGAAITELVNQANTDANGGDGTGGLDLENLDLEDLNLEQFDLEDLESLGIDPNNVDINELSETLLSAINLNTLGSEIDRVLGQAGLELRRGEVYLSRLGAERLNARPGDTLEIFIGPIPLPYQVKGIVEQAGPVAALSPVVVMNLDEAQRLLFMEDRVNNVLISNLGDELEGLEYTEEVSERLRVLALGDEAVAEMADLLREPDVAAALEEAAAEARREAEDPFGEDGPPPFIANLLEGIIPFGGVADNVIQLVEELEQPGVSDELRRILANREVQFWLMDLDVSAERRDQIREAVSRLTEIDLLDPLNKQVVVTAADVGGTVFSTIFSLFGIFSILAGVLLIFMIFVMLAAERRSEMGMARAVGMQRRQLVQMFVTEGVIYDLVAAALGVVLGLGIAYLMIGFIGGVFNNVTQTFSEQLTSVLQFRFTVVPSSIVIAYCLGVLLTFIVVTLASWRVSRLNIVAAIRDLPEDNSARGRAGWQRIVRLLFALALLGGGIYVILMGDALEITRTQIGASLALAGVAFLLDWALWLASVRDENRQRLVYSLLGLGLLLLWVAPWSAWLGGAGAIFEQDPATVLLSFALAGPLIILGAILTVMFNADVLLWLVNRVLGGIGALTPVLKTAIAYPLSARFRTGMAMLLFAMIITTVTIMSIVITATQTVVSTDDERYAGFDLETNTTLLSFFNPIRDLEAAIARNPDFDADSVAAVARITENTVPIREVSVDGEVDERASQRIRSTDELMGINDGYIEQAAQYYTFRLRAPGYETDAEIWQALLERDDVAIVPPWLVGRGFDPGEEPNGPPSDGEQPAAEPFGAVEIDEEEFNGDDFDDWRYQLRRLPGVDADAEALPPITLTLAPPTGAAGGEIQEVQVIGVLEQTDTLVDGAVQVPQSTVERLLGEPSTNVEFYVEVSEGYDVRQVAQELESAFLSGGLNVVVLADAFAAGQAVTRGVLQLFQGFMALGLLVGIAALGVISSRTVVERRQQIGVLRAIGYQPRMVALSFLLESSFIALVGIGIGTATGVVLGHNIIGELYAAVTQGASIATPWLQIGLILLIAYGFSLLTTILPAFQASRIYPAEALRYD
jgi:putative ABC transport system permease protein